MGDFEAFVAEHYAPVRAALSVALGDPDRAAEVAQEAFARAWPRWSAVSVMERPVAWVYVVAMNCARRDLRRAQRASPPAALTPMADLAGAVATSVSLRAAVLSLAPRQRAAVVLRYLADLTVSEVASAMGCAEGTVKSTLHAALANLRIELDEDDDQ